MKPTAKLGSERCLNCGKRCEIRFMSTTLGRLFCDPNCAAKYADSQMTKAMLEIQDRVKKGETWLTK